MTGKVFLNYRRSDADAWADRLFERLIRHFPRENVFMDIDGNIPMGFPWAQWLDKQVASCDLMLALIGRSWVQQFQVHADADDRDFVRVEIESALVRMIPVVPVFLGDAPVPRAADLPESVRPLMALQATRLQRLTFDADAESLVSGIARSIALARGEAVRAPQAQSSPAVAPATPQPNPTARWQSEGRIRIPAPVVHGALKDGDAGWFLPGNGRTEWFKDYAQGPEMVVIPSGEFVMGSPDDEPERIGEGHPQTDIFGIEEPRRTVRIAHPFAVSRCAVTVDEFVAFVQATGHTIPEEMFTYENGKWETRKGRSWRNPGFAQTGRHPVVGVSWNDAMAYVAWLSQATDKKYRLLSEAEWEYAARAGTATPYWWGKAITPAQANYDGNYVYAGGGAMGAYRKAILPVDYAGEQFQPNPWGLHQVHGNVWEWCEDVFHPSYDGAPVDSSPWLVGGDQSRRIVRGGSSRYNPQLLRAAVRGRNPVGLRVSGLSFRVGRTL